jgi:hypothetical protein
MTVKDLQFLDEGSQFSVASVSGLEGPVVVLNPKFLWTLKQVLDRAREHARVLTPAHARPILDLCEELGRVLEKYDTARTKYYGSPDPGPPAERSELEQVERELAELAKILSVPSSPEK